MFWLAYYYSCLMLFHGNPIWNGLRALRIIIQEPYLNIWSRYSGGCEKERAGGHGAILKLGLE